MQREKSTLPESGIEDSGGMALAQNEAVAILPARLFWADTQHAPIKASQNIRHGKTTAYVRGLRSVDHPHGMSAQPLCNLYELFNLWHVSDFPCTILL